MPTLCINQPRCKVTLTSERLRILPPEDAAADAAPKRDVPLHDVERVIMVGSTRFSGRVLEALMRRQIPVVLIDGRGRLLGSFQPPPPAHAAQRSRQYECMRDPDFVLQMAARIVTAKIYNQRRILQRLAANRKQDISDSLTLLHRMLVHTGKVTSIEQLRGKEGAAAALYFDLWATFLPAQFPFEKRSTRPPLNPVNACISFGATLLYQETATFLHGCGLDPGLGLFHVTEDGRWSLALDLMEPFRPVLVEALTLDLFTHQMVGAEDFQPCDGGIHLNKKGRRTFLLQYERRMERQFTSEHVGHRTTLRAMLEQQATDFKAALDDPARFEPFLMN